MEGIRGRRAMVELQMKPINVSNLTPREVTGACAMFPRNYSLRMEGEQVILEVDEE